MGLTTPQGTRFGGVDAWVSSDIVSPSRPMDCVVSSDTSWFNGDDIACYFYVWANGCKKSREMFLYVIVQKIRYVCIGWRLAAPGNSAVWWPPHTSGLVSPVAGRRHVLSSDIFLLQIVNAHQNMPNDTGNI